MDFVIFVINFLFAAYYILLGVRALLPWFKYGLANPLLEPVYLLTEPLLAPVRAGLPPARMGMDVSPFVLLILLWIAQQVILRIIA